MGRSGGRQREGVRADWMRDGADDATTCSHTATLSQRGAFLVLACSIGRSTSVAQSDCHPARSRTAQSRRASRTPIQFCDGLWRISAGHAREGHRAASRGRPASHGGRRGRESRAHRFASKAATEFDVASCRALIDKARTPSTFLARAQTIGMPATAARACTLPLLAFHNLGKEEQGASQARYVQTVELLFGGGRRRQLPRPARQLEPRKLHSANGCGNTND